MKSSQRATAMACVNKAPIEVRTASTEKGSAQSSIRISPPAPTASPVLRMVPRVPGSRSACATIQSGAACRAGVDRAKAAGARLRFLLAADFVKDVLAGLDRLAPGSLDRLDQRRDQF